ncbi:hypothetical protein HMPREF1492_0574 [Atopobium sp. BS2]|nr:hypothetical protein HMPREF1492_0574 [Atopobium sp. BS2]
MSCAVVLSWQEGSGVYRVSREKGAPGVRRMQAECALDASRVRA